MDTLSRFNAARRYEGRALLIAINAVASLSIFFFGYDQGVMGGVNNNCNYATTMKFGTCASGDKNEVTVNHTLLQGGIVSLRFDPAREITINGNSGRRLLSSRHTGGSLDRRLVR